MEEVEVERGLEEAEVERDVEVEEEGEVAVVET